MKLSRDNVTKGLTRLYVVAFLSWLVYWLLWAPLEHISKNEKVAYALGEPYRDEILKNLTLVNAWQQLFQEGPVFPLILFIGIPLVGYVALRAGIAVTFWVIKGFSNENL